MGFTSGMIRVACAVLRLSCRPRFLTPEGKRRNPEPAEASVLICNHNSATNGPLLYACLHGNAAMLVAKDWYDQPRWHKWLVAAHTIPVDRTGLDTQWLRLAAAALKEGRSVVIFPEGRVRKDGQLNPFKSGFAMLAAMTGKPVVPMSLCGRYTPLKPARFVVGEPETLQRVLRADYLTEETRHFQALVDSNRGLTVSGKPNKKH